MKKLIWTLIAHVSELDVLLMCTNHDSKIFLNSNFAFGPESVWRRILGCLAENFTLKADLDCEVRLVQLMMHCDPIVSWVGLKCTMLNEIFGMESNSGLGQAIELKVKSALKG